MPPQPRLADAHLTRTKPRSISVHPAALSKKSVLSTLDWQSWRIQTLSKVGRQSGVASTAIPTTLRDIAPQMSLLPVRITRWPTSVEGARTSTETESLRERTGEEVMANLPPTKALMSLITPSILSTATAEQGAGGSHDTSRWAVSRSGVSGAVPGSRCAKRDRCDTSRSWSLGATRGVSLRCDSLPTVYLSPAAVSSIALRNIFRSN